MYLVCHPDLHAGFSLPLYSYKPEGIFPSIAQTARMTCKVQLSDLVYRTTISETWIACYGYFAFSHDRNQSFKVLFGVGATCVQ